jgi:mannan endo-1,4-beta-mannosidase
MLSLLVFTACHHKKSYDTIGDSGLTTRTENLRTNLCTFADKGVLMGHEYGIVAGVGFRNDTTGRSDFNSICNDLPAAVGFELSGIERGAKQNIDSVDFNVIRTQILNYMHHGGLVMMRWTAPRAKSDGQMHEWVKKVADYLGSIQDGYGIKVPIVLCLYPLTGKEWYDDLPSGEYTRMYQQAMNWMHEAGLTNAIFAYSCSTVGSDSKFFEKCPGNGIDVIDFNYMVDDISGYADTLNKMAQMLSDFSKSQNKAVGITTGVRGIQSDTLWTFAVLPVIQKYHLSYFMLGKNMGEAKDRKYYAPYPGEKSVANFMQMYNDKHTLFMSDVNGLYLSKDEKENNK